LFTSITEEFDTTVVLFGVKFTELAFLLIIVNGICKDDSGNGGKDGGALDPADTGLIWVVVGAIVFVDADSERDKCGDGEEN
jgi:hypothetical protein